MNTVPVLVDVAVKDLSGAALDWAIAVSGCVTVEGNGLRFDLLHRPTVGGDFSMPYQPSTNWSQAGPLIDKYKACFAAYDYGYLCLLAHNDLHHGQGKGPDHLTAACRAIVAAHLGDIVKVPHCLVMP